MSRRANFSGEQVGPYLVRERIGHGGMADVYRAFQTTVNREVALKLIPLTADPEHDVFRERFHHEAEIIAALEHPHILPIFDYGISSDVLYISMRYLRGGTLNDVLAYGPLPSPWVIGRLESMSAALGYAHQRGVIHRDLKPSNVLLDDDQQAYLADFGLATVLGESSQLTTPGSIVGTPAYMSPEQLLGDSIDHRADLYSLGVMLYQMLAGRLPFEAQSTFLLIDQQIENAPPSPLEFNPDLPPSVADLLLRALAKDPAKRFASAQQLSEAFASAYGHDATLHEPQLIAPARVYRRRAQEHPGLDGIPIDQLPAGGDGQQEVTAADTDASDPITNQIPSSRQQSRSAGTILGAVAFLVIIAVASVFFLRAAGDALPPFTMLSGVEGVAREVVPTGEEVARSKRVLGPDGFIAYVTCNQTSEFFAVMARRIFDSAQEYGVPVRLYDSETNASQQIIDIERARREGAMGLIVCVVAEDVVSETLAAAADDGLPLVLHNIAYPPDFDAVIMTHDEYMLGHEPGLYAGMIVAQQAEETPNVVILDFPDLPSIVERADGLTDGFLTHVPDANVVGRYLGGTTSFGRRSIQRLLDNGVEIDVILSINDAGAYGAIEALEQADIDPDEVVIVGIDAEAVARDYIREGHFMWATMQVANEQMPSVLLDSVIKQLGGGTIPQIVVLSPGELITRSE